MFIFFLELEVYHGVIYLKSLSMLTLIVINFPLSTAFAMSKVSCKNLFSFSFDFMFLFLLYFFKGPLIIWQFIVQYSCVKYILHILHILLLNSSLNPLWSQKYRRLFQFLCLLICFYVLNIIYFGESFMCC
jgi:hypothetical protein